MIGGNWNTMKKAWPGPRLQVALKLTNSQVQTNGFAAPIPCAHGHVRARPFAYGLPLWPRGETPRNSSNTDLLRTRRANWFCIFNTLETEGS